MFCQDKRRRILGLFLVLTFLIPLSLDAEEPSTGVNTITADKTEYISKDRKSIFIGNVKVTRNEVTMDSDRLEVFFDQKGQKIIKSVGYGNVKIVREDITAISQEVIFLEEEGKIVLTGNPMVQRGGDKLFGDKITLFLKKGLVIVEGNTRVVIMPETAKKL
jgi:lipopolysaccharide export system protein LptA